MTAERLACERERCWDVKHRPEWGEGPWQGEPDRVDFQHAGFSCFIHRNHHVGNWCGYVGVPMRHPAAGHHYDELPVQVHGGLTFRDTCEPGSHLCHVGKRLTWFGFDCAHAWDVSPGLDADLRRAGLPPLELPGRPSHYWTQAEVIRETRGLAAQLARLRGSAIRYDRRAGEARNPDRQRVRTMKAMGLWVAARKPSHQLLALQQARKP